MSYTPALNTILLGDPKAPTPTAGDSDTSIATTAFVTGAITTAVPTNSVTTNTTQTITGAKTFTTNPTVWDGSGAPIKFQNDANIQFKGTSTGSTLLAGVVTTDSNNRIQINADGKVLWGTGSAATDTNLYRSGVGALTTDTDLDIGGSLFVNGSGGLNFGTGSDAGFARTGSGVIAVTGKIQQTTAPTNANDLVNKNYVDALQQSLDIKQSVRAGTTANVVLASGGLPTIDGVALNENDRVLNMFQTTASENGIYTAHATGGWTRATDASVSADVTAGMYTFVSEGTTNGNNGFVLTTDDPITLGTTALTFTQFSGAGTVIAGNGLTKTGNTLDVGGTTNRIVANADSIDISSSYVGQASITTLGTITTGTWTGTAIAIANGGTGATSLGAAQTALDITTLSTTQTISGAKTFSTEVISSNATSTSNAFSANATAGTTWSVTYGGTVKWPANSFTLIPSSSGLTLTTGFTIRTDSPTNGSDLTNKTYVDSATNAVLYETPTTVSTNYTVLSTDRAVLVNGSSTVTISLPGTHVAGQKVNVKDIAGIAGTSNITIQSADSDLIDGAASATINTNYQSLSFLSNGTNWFIV